ncbi:MAG: hypothetical protein HC895_09920 [Leptolyngbyaceae cyanobacterium SM1_3_5]|nr:hypothetical protein [Leptolyngbyaceae cyanobacterium SM1_3_5]
MNHYSVWSAVLLASTVQLLTPSLAQADEPDRAIAVPINTVFMHLSGEQLQLWVEGDRCDLPLEVVQQSEELDELTEVQIHLTHTVLADSNCLEETVPFRLPIDVQQSIESGNLYRILVNDYDLTIDITNR